MQGKKQRSHPRQSASASLHIGHLRIGRHLSFTATLGQEEDPGTRFAGSLLKRCRMRGLEQSVLSGRVGLQLDPLFRGKT
jgi:hypothetical protein